MPAAKPVYRTRRERYEIDHCTPQQRAVQNGKIEFHALTKGHYLGTRIPRGILPGLSSIGFWNAAGNQDWGLDHHRNEGIELMFLETGRMAFLADQKEYALQAGNFTITRPWQLHKLGAPNIGPGRLHWLILDVGVRRPHQEWRWPAWLVLAREDLAELTRQLRYNESPVWEATPAIANSFRELAECVLAWEEPHRVSRLAAQINLLLVRVLDVLTREPIRENKHLTSHQRTVKLFLADLESGRVELGTTWTLETMAEHCGMGKSALSKYCLELVNVSPVEFLNQCRLDRAARQLRQQKDLSITDIAFANGFNSSQYFATIFLRRFGASPRDYRRGRGNGGPALSEGTI